MRDDLPSVFAAGKRFFEDDPHITGQQLYAEVGHPATEAGWELGGRHAGHLVGEFPNERIDGADMESSIAQPCPAPQIQSLSRCTSPGFNSVAA